MRWMLLILLLARFAIALGEAPIILEKVDIRPNDKAAILRGAKFFAQNCMVCHTMQYLQYDPIAQQAGITLDKMPLNNKNWWMNVAPPDLSSIAHQKGPEWIYTYLHSFYKDPKRPTGHNNLLDKDVNMMDILAPFQGEQELTEKGKKLLENPDTAPEHYYTALELVKSGSMNQEEFDANITDLVNFLVYAADPHRSQREHLGFWVLLFLGVLLVFAYLLKKEYWKNVK